MPRRRRPQPGSLFRTLQENAGASLYVVPICWTDLHAKLLNARWVERPTITTPVPLPGRRYKVPSPTAATLNCELSTLVAKEETRAFCKVRAIKNIMSTFYPHTCSRAKSAVELDVYVGDRVFRKACRVHVLWQPARTSGDLASFDSAATRGLSFTQNTLSGSQRSRATSQSSLPTPPTQSPVDDEDSQSSQPRANQPPLVAFLNRTQLDNVRRNLFRVVPGPNGTNEPVASLQRLRSKMLVPARPEHDAYYLGVMLAMAQSYFYGEGPCADGQSGSSPSSPTYKHASSSQRSVRRSDDVDNPPVFRDVTVHLLTHSETEAGAATGTNDQNGATNHSSGPPHLLVHRAVVSAALLRLFHYPREAPCPSNLDLRAGIRVEYVRVPVWPVLGLKERLARALGAEVVGDWIDSVVDGVSEIETWGMLSEDEREERERRRRALANASAARRNQRQHAGQQNHKRESAASAAATVAAAMASCEVRERHAERVVSLSQGAAVPLSARASGRPLPQLVRSSSYNYGSGASVDLVAGKKRRRGGDGADADDVRHMSISLSQPVRSTAAAAIPMFSSALRRESDALDAPDNLLTSSRESIGGDTEAYDSSDDERMRSTADAIRSPSRPSPGSGTPGGSAKRQKRFGHPPPSPSARRAADDPLAVPVVS